MGNQRRVLAFKFCRLLILCEAGSPKASSTVGNGIPPGCKLTDRDRDRDRYLELCVMEVIEGEESDDGGSDVDNDVVKVEGDVD